MGAPPTELKKGLEQRHLTMIAMDGVIGVGLFVGSRVVIGKASVRICTPSRSAMNDGTSFE